MLIVGQRYIFYSVSPNFMPLGSGVGSGVGVGVSSSSSSLSSALAHTSLALAPFALQIYEKIPLAVHRPAEFYDNLILLVSCAASPIYILLKSLYIDTSCKDSSNNKC